MATNPFQGKKALVTGAASGIGRAFAIELARHGCDVYLLDVNMDGLEDLLVELREFGICAVAEWCDLSQPHEISAALNAMTHRWGPIDVLVNNAGILYYGPTDAMRAEQWDRILSVNLNAPIQIVRELLVSLIDRPDVYVVNVCSIAGLVAGGGRTAAYQTTKFGLVGFTEALRAEYGRRGMNVTAVCSGTVETGLYENADSGRKDGSVPRPPSWVNTTAEAVARKGLRAARRNRAKVVISPAAHLLNICKRFAPGLLDFAHQFGRWRRLRKYRQQQRQNQLAGGTPAEQSEVETVRPAA